MDCVWHLHLKFDDGTEACRNYIGHHERDIALEAEEDVAARRGRKIVSHKYVACVQDTCGQSVH